MSTFATTVVKRMNIHVWCAPAAAAAAASLLLVPLVLRSHIHQLATARLLQSS
jgi:hypothetical protein